MDARARARAVLECIERADAARDEASAPRRGSASASDGDGGDALPGVSASGGGKRRRRDAEAGTAIEEGAEEAKRRRRDGDGDGDGEGGNGVREADLKKMLEGRMTVQERAEAINELLNQRKIDIFRRGDSLVFARVREEQAAKFKGLSTEDMLVYQIIQHAGNAGMWTKELKQRSNLPVPQITKIFKTLEARKLIKSVKHVAQQNRKVYMLYDLEPSREITGGAWYTEQEYDAEFISVLREQCVKFICSKDRVTLEEVSDFVRSSKLSHVELRSDDVLQIVNTLVYDGRIDEIVDESQDDGMSPVTNDDSKPPTYYSKALLAIPEHSPFTDVPCGVCPVINECRPDGLINPTSCEYLNAWLQF